MRMKKFCLPKRVFLWLALLSIFATSATVLAASPAPERVASVKANGVVLTMRVPNEPVFLSELLPVDVSLTNENVLPIELVGRLGSTLYCNAALRLSIQGGGAPYFQLPNESDTSFHGCIPRGTIVQPHQTITTHYFQPMTASGTITLKASTPFLIGGGYTTGFDKPFVYHVPTLTLNVSPQIPAGRKLSLQLSGSRISVNGPAPARAHLYYLEFGECTFAGGSAIHRLLIWTPLPAPTLHVPDCGDDSLMHGDNLYWGVSVGAPGYAIATL